MKKTFNENENKNEGLIIGRNPVLEALNADKSVDTVYVSGDGGIINKICAVAKAKGAVIKNVSATKLDYMSGGGNHQGVVASLSVADYCDIDDIFNLAAERNEKPFIIVCDEIEDPHNLGAIIRTANQAGAHGVIIPKRHAVGLTATVAKTSAGALNYTPVAKVTNLSHTIEQLKERGMWFVCADMDGEVMYNLDLKGPIGVVIGNEGEGVGRLVKEKCDFVAKIPMKGDIDSLNASVAMGILSFEIVRQRDEWK